MNIIYYSKSRLNITEAKYKFESFDFQYLILKIIKFIVLMENKSKKLELIIEIKKFKTFIF